MLKKKSSIQHVSQLSIALNRKASHVYFIEQKYEVGIVLNGWEVKSLRAGKVQIANSYVLIKKGEAWLLGSVITPLISISTHVKIDPNRTRKLLLHRKELNTLLGFTDRRGYTLIPLMMYWWKNHVKIEIGLSKGKKKYDKRAEEKTRQWKIEKQRILKHYSKCHRV